MPESLDFQALIPEPLEITSRDGRKWEASPELMGDEAMYFIRNRSNMAGAEATEKAIAVMLRCLRVHHKKLTEAEMLHAFTLGEIVTTVMRFLALSGRLAVSTSPAPTPRKKQPVKQR